MTPSAETAVSRPHRGKVRLGCWLETDQLQIPGIVTNMSASGLFVRLGPDATFEQLRAGTQVRFQLRLDDTVSSVRGLAEVARGSDSPSTDPSLQFCIGLNFIDIDPADLERLQRFVDASLQTVVLLDDDPDHAAAYAELSAEYRFIRCSNSTQALEALSNDDVSVLITNEQLPDMHCLALLQLVSERFPSACTSRVVVSDYTIAGQLRTLINIGKVFSYLRKPFSGAFLTQAVRRASNAYELAIENRLLNAELERANEHLTTENRYLRQRFVGFGGFERLVGNSKKLRSALDDLDRIRKSDISGHLVGETGTGKELAARALHEGGRRAGKPFVAQNCAGLGEGMLHSTLFGHRKGAFTGATRDHAGVFQQADGGTLFLDEVSEMTPNVQATLLRALQEGEITPLGSTAPFKVDVRVISATQKDLRREVQQGRFREDLFFRLVVVAVELPPLRERSGDVPILAMHFLDLHCEAAGTNIRGFTSEAMSALERYAWPGNVRELENEIERLVVLTNPQQKVPLELLSPHIRNNEPTAALPVAGSAGFAVSCDGTFDACVDALQRRLITRALEKSGGHVTRAALELGIDRSRLTKLRDRLADEKQG